MVERAEPVIAIADPGAARANVVDMSRKSARVDIPSSWGSVLIGFKNVFEE